VALVLALMLAVLAVLVALGYFAVVRRLGAGAAVSDRGADNTELLLPESRPWIDALRSPGFLWLLAFLAINYLALAVAMGVHGAGFDDCEVAPTSGGRATMAAVAGAAVAASAALALWKVRGWALVAALGGVALAGMAWFILVFPTQSC
jgi:hypothetical protein